MRALPGFHDQQLDCTPLSDHGGYCRKQRTQRRVLDKQHVCQGRGGEFEGVGVIGIGVLVEGRVEDCADPGSAGGLLQESSGEA